jgi:transporter family protein
MERWVVYAFISTFFAGATSVIAKGGLDGISAELGLGLRTCFVFAFVLIFCALSVPRSEIAQISGTNCLWLGLSAATTAASWVYYYRALKLGQVSTVAVIDKASFLVAVALAWLVLRETPSTRVLIGCAFILTGLFIVSKR